ncbi:transcriptional regulator, MarR family [Alkaliphilus metalliredigens QYMF]|uniref:Transcriptional regulator, MarR family n=1 Tax=Alkaliphilus metalliredigens (strain QYMF) TaxID=293826 RepID=A6TPW4_ALKMQ|nr:MarR family transcriptional regulator [Alkaliphilus metalliredigens]ABR48232.1 transcriptional regulator, MarR family [Alkaliphilus metalliredigens QYMF]
MNDYDGLKLDNQLCFSVYACSREIIKLYKPFLTKLDITYTQYITLLVLWEKPKITAKELGEKLYLDSGTLTPLLKKLESKELITRKRSTKDERIMIVTLTDKGRELKDAAVEIPEKVFCETQLNIEEAVRLKDSLTKLLNKIT